MIGRCSILVLLVMGEMVRAGDDVDLRNLVGQLGSEKFAVRESATKALEKIGAPALPFLLDLGRKGDFETCRRADLIYHKIQGRMLAVTALKPRMVRFQFADQPLGRVLQDMRRTTGLTFTCDRSAEDARITLDTGELPFWQALEAFGKKSGWSEAAELPMTSLVEATTSSTLQFYPAFPYVAQNTTRLIQQPPPKLPTWIEGPIRVRVLPKSWHRDSLSRKPKDALLFYLEVRVDPKLPLLSLDHLSINSLVDQRGKSIQVESPMRLPASHQPIRISVEAPTIQSNHFIFPVESKESKDLGGSWAEGKCVILAHLQVQAPFAEIKDLAKQVGELVVGPNQFSLKVLSARVRDDGDLRVHISVDNVQAFKEVGLQPEVVRVRPGFVAIRGPADLAADHTEIFDSRGRPLQRRSVASKPLANQPDGVELIMTYQGPFASLAGLRLVVAVPRYVPVEVPFTLRQEVRP